VIDLYCERIGPGLWAEPANVTSNVAFLCAAWAIWRLGRDGSAPASLVRLFAGITTVIAAGSALFHVLATGWARVLDEAPIVFFQIAFLWSYGRHVMRIGRGAALILIAGLIASSVSIRLMTGAVNNSLPYLPALILTLVLGISHVRANRRSRWSLLLGAVVFVLAVFLRTLDNAVCASFPLGTHLFWHVLAAVVLYLFARGLLTNVSRYN
jgi:hypothetical protein